jgi:hypothetical protein
LISSPVLCFGKTGCPKRKETGRRGPNWVVSLKKVLAEVSAPDLGLPYLSLHCFAHILH